ncbi:XRE family transcriptional regulator [Streptomyces daliensis]
MNQTLYGAMARRGVKPGELARKVGVDPKTVKRWLADASRAPHQVTRAAVAEALGVRAEVLWPKSLRETVKMGPDREIVSAYPYRNACPTSVWADLIASASQSITFAGYTNYFIWQEQPRLADRLKRKLHDGCRVRFLVGDPDSEVTRKREEVEGVPLTVGTRIRITLDALEKMRGVPGLEARFSDQHIALSVFAFDDQMLVTPHLSSLLGHDSPMLHLRRLGEDGLFDRFQGHVAALWEGSPRPVWE